MEFRISPRAFAAWLALAGILFRLAAPTGFMPMAVADGQGFEIVICSASGGMRTITVDADGQPVGQPDREQGKQESHSCPYAAAPVLALSLAAPLLQLILIETGADQPGLRDLSESVPDIASHGPRAPPSLLIHRIPHV